MHGAAGAPGRKETAGGISACISPMRLLSYSFAICRAAEKRKAEDDSAEEGGKRKRD
jgi:hypothetical protein